MQNAIKEIRPFLFVSLVCDFKNGTCSFCQPACAANILINKAIDRDDSMWIPQRESGRVFALNMIHSSKQVFQTARLLYYFSRSFSIKYGCTLTNMCFPQMLHYPWQCNTNNIESQHNMMSYSNERFVNV